MTKFSIQTIYKNPKLTGQTVAKLEHLQSIIDLRRRRSHDPPSSKNARKVDCQSDQRIVINVGGMRFETLKSTLERFPSTLLGNSQRRSLFYDKKRDEYFFDRHRLCFEAILYYYQSIGRLRRPDHVSLDIFLEEITFFDLGSDALKQVRIDEDLGEAKQVKLPQNGFRRHLWANLEYPQYSMTAKIINIISIVFIILSAIGLAIQTVPKDGGTGDDSCKYEGDGMRINGYNRSAARLCQPDFQSPFFIIQSICVGFFTIEFLLRVISSPSHFDFIKSIPNWIDFFAIASFFITFVILNIFCCHTEISSRTYCFLRLLRVFRFLRVFKLYRTFQHIKALRVLASTLKESIPDFIILISFLTISSFLFGATIYYTENDTQNGVFDSIPKAIYYGVITLTAVGYGDLTPVTTLGRCLACLAAIYGVSVVSMLVSVLVDRYQRVFARKHFLNEEYTENTVRNDSLLRSHRANQHIESQFDVEKHVDTTSECYNHIPAPEENNEGSSKVRFIIGYLSDDDSDGDLDQTDGDEDDFISKVAKELLNSATGKYLSMGRNNGTL